MPARIAINGFGRIGRAVVRSAIERGAHRDLALLLAGEDARTGDCAQDLHALDAAAALGGLLPALAAEKRGRGGTGPGPEAVVRPRALRITRIRTARTSARHP